MNNAPSIREALLHYSKQYQRSQFSLEALEVDSLISTSLLLEKYMGLMINLSGLCCSAQLFFTAIRTQIWKWISKCFKHYFILLHKEKLYLAWISPSFLLPWYSWKKVQNATDSSAATCVQRLPLDDGCGGITMGKFLQRCTESFNPMSTQFFTFYSQQRWGFCVYLHSPHVTSSCGERRTAAILHSYRILSHKCVFLLPSPINLHPKLRREEMK